MPDVTMGYYVDQVFQVQDKVQQAVVMILATTDC